MGDISKNFNRTEFACKCGCSYDTVDAELLHVLQDIRDHFGVPVVIQSACRCAKHNEKVGGSKNSQHLYGRAADIHLKGGYFSELVSYVHQKHKGKYGIGTYSGWIHIDTRSGKAARWKG